MNRYFHQDYLTVPDGAPLYYQDPGGKPAYAAGPRRTADGRDYVPVYDDAVPAPAQPQRDARAPADRGRILFEFGLLYLGFAVILILAAVWLGLWFAEGLSRPVGRLLGASERVGAGDFDVRVIEDDGEDEIAAREAGIAPGRSKMPDGRALDAALRALGVDAHAPLARHSDHAADAILTAAWLRRVAGDDALWHPHGLDAVRMSEGWTLGVR